MKYKYILFDWDGTLAKTLDIWLDGYKYVCNKLEIDISNLSEREVVETFFGKFGEGYKNFGVTDTIKAYEEVKKFVDEKVSTVILYPNVNLVLDKLKARGIKLALHTSSSRNLLYPAIVNNRLDQYFNVILTRDDVLKGKPDPEVILKELEFFRASPSKALIVGDSDSDIKAGKNAGVDTVLFYPMENEKFYKSEVLLKEKPNFCTQELIELLNIVQ